jgi:hypothetical protein
MIMNTKKRFSIKAFVFCAALSLLAVLTGCPTPFKDIPAEADIMEELLPILIGGDFVAKMEAEAGKLTKIATTGDLPGVYTGGVASGRAYVKNIGELQGFVDLTVPADVKEGAYGLTLVWTGSATGTVAVTINPTDDKAPNADSPATKEIAYKRSGDEWDMNDPQYLKIFTPGEEGIPQIESGDIIRIHNAKLGDPDQSKWICLDVVYLSKLSKAKTQE